MKKLFLFKIVSLSTSLPIFKKIFTKHLNIIQQLIWCILQIFPLTDQFCNFRYISSVQIWNVLLLHLLKLCWICFFWWKVLLQMNWLIFWSKVHHVKITLTAVVRDVSFVGFVSSDGGSFCKWIVYFFKLSSSFI